jgi:hypothetical protein
MKASTLAAVELKERNSFTTEFAKLLHHRNRQACSKEPFRTTMLAESWVRRHEASADALLRQKCLDQRYGVSELERLLALNRIRVIAP